jgi:hypothetical protein
MSDAEFAARGLTLAEDSLRRLAEAVPALGDMIGNLDDATRQIAIMALAGELAPKW